MRIAALLLVTLLLSACGTSDAQRDFEDEAAGPPQGITRTDADGNVIGEPDPADWRTGPLFTGVAVDPIYPNPASNDFGGNVRLVVTAPFSGTLRGQVVLFATNRRATGPFLVRLADVPANAFPGSAVLAFNLADFRAGLGLADARGLYRLYLQDGTGRLVSYGDFQVE